MNRGKFKRSICVTSEQDIKAQKFRARKRPTAHRETNQATWKKNFHGIDHVPEQQSKPHVAQVVQINNFGGKSKLYKSFAVIQWVWIAVLFWHTGEETHYPRTEVQQSSDLGTSKCILMPCLTGNWGFRNINKRTTVEGTCSSSLHLSRLQCRRRWGLSSTSGFRTSLILAYQFVIHFPVKPQKFNCIECRRKFSWKICNNMFCWTSATLWFIRNSCEFRVSRRRRIKIYQQVSGSLRNSHHILITPWSHPSQFIISSIIGMGRTPSYGLFSCFFSPDPSCQNIN